MLSKDDARLLQQMTGLFCESIEDLRHIEPAPKACVRSIKKASRAELRGVMIEVLRQYHKLEA